MYVIAGATGNTGSVVADTLLAKGQKVRVIGRDATRLERFTRKGAEAFVGDVADAAAMAQAFAGAKAAYLMIPPNVAAPDVRAYQDRVTEALVGAVEKNHVLHSVALSSFGADKPNKTGPVVGLHVLEQKLNAIPGLHALALRAAYFMENTLPQAAVIQSLGMMAGPVREDLVLPMIATRDIGPVAADALLKLDFQGKSTREVQGGVDVTYAEVARIIGAAIGKPGLSYMHVGPAQLKPALMRMGFSANMADLLFEMTDALNSGHMACLEPRSPQNTAPTTFEAFVTDVFLPAFRGKSAAV